MANRIQGITIEIGGDTTKLAKAMSGINKDIGSTQSQLKDVERLLKLDPTNTELLRQKQDLLAQSVEKTKEKLEALKSADEQAKQQLADGKLSQDQYNALSREIAETELKLESLEKQASNSNATLSQISAVTSEFGEKTEAAGKKMLPLTGTIVGVGAASLKAFSDVDEGMDTIIKKTGATGDAAKDMEDIYKDLGSSMPNDLSDIGAAVGELNTRFDFTGDKLKDASKSFLHFAEINEIDVNSAVQLVSRAMGDAGIPADQYGGVLDMLTVASQKSGISIDSLSTNLAKYGAPMRALGVDTQTSIAMFAGWEKAGVNTETAFSGMKKAISNWSASGKDASVEFGKTLEQIKAAPDLASATTMAIDTFGTKAGPDLADAIRGGRFEVDEYIAALQNSSGAVESTFAGTEDGIDSAKTAMNSVKIALSELGSTLGEMLGPILENIAEKVKSFSSWFGNLDDSTKKTILTIGGIIAVIGPALIIIGKISSGISAVIGVASKVGGVIKIVQGAFGGLNAVMAANPVLIIVAAIAALVAGFIYLWNNCEGFRNFWIGLWDGIKSVCSAAIDGICGFFTETLPNAWGAVTDFFGGIGDWFGGIWDGVKTGASNAWTNIKDNMSGTWDSIKNTASTVWGGISDFFGNWYDTTCERSAQSWAKTKEIASSAWTGIKDTASNVWGGISGFFTNWYDTMSSRTSAAWTNITGGIGSACGKIKDVVSNGFTAAIDWIKNLPSQALNWGKDIIMGIVNGIKNAIGYVKNAVKGVADTIRSFLHFSVPDTGPLADFDTYMPDMMQGLAKGMTKNIPTIKRALEQVSGSMATGLQPTIAPTSATAGIQTKTVSNSFSPSITLKIDRFENNSGDDINGLADQLMERMQVIYTRKGAVFGG